MTLRYVLACLLLYSQLNLGAQPERRYSFSHPQMGSLFSMVVYSSDDSLANQAARAAFARIDELNEILSDYLPDSELSRLAETAGKDSCRPVSDDLWAVLEKSREVARKSGGAFDISIGPLSRLWRRAFRRQEFPPDSAIRQALKAVNYRRVRLKKSRQAVCLIQPGMRLDAGGIAKGYAVDEALKVLKRFGISRALVEGGGDLAVSQAPPGQEEGWRILVPAGKGENPSADSILFIREAAIATSGDTYRYLEWEGKRYSHLIDPRTGLGVTHRVLVSVGCPSGMEADALASAISILGPEGPWRRLLRRFPKCWARLLVPTSSGMDLLQFPARKKASPIQFSTTKS